MSDVQLFAITLAAYATYVVNAAQFLFKLRAARLQMEAEAFSAMEVVQ
jgi:3-vinyl bacteriochlorophyllide hydratase